MITDSNDSDSDNESDVSWITPDIGMPRLSMSPFSLSAEDSFEDGTVR